jgi:hypothetical protein
MLDRCSDNLDRCSDNLDVTLTMLAAHAHDLAERDLDVPGNSEQLRAVALVILHPLNERERLATGRAVAL